MPLTKDELRLANKRVQACDKVVPDGRTGSVAGDGSLYLEGYFFADDLRLMAWALDGQALGLGDKGRRVVEELNQ